MTDFANKHDIAATADDVRRIHRQLAAFFTDVESIEPPYDGYIQLHHSKAIRDVIGKRDSLWGAFGASMAMAEMPDRWPTRYRASVAYHLAPLLAEVVHS